MNIKIDREEAMLLADYEPIASEFREHALMEWRQEEKVKSAFCMSCTGKMSGLPWKYVRLELEE